MTRVLVVDDEPQILRALRINLRVRHYDVQTAATGTGALEQAAKHPPDLVILDLGLPDLDGVEVIQGLRGWTTAPIIVLSGRSDSIDKVEALDAGADDYITKPFGMEELLARMRAVGRRATADGDEPRVRLGDLVVDLAAKRVIREPDDTSAPATADGRERAGHDQAGQDQADQDQADQKPGGPGPGGPGPGGPEPGGPGPGGPETRRTRTRRTRTRRTRSRLATAGRTSGSPRPSGTCWRCCCAIRASCSASSSC